MLSSVATLLNLCALAAFGQIITEPDDTDANKVPATVKPVEEDDSASSGWFQKLFNSTANKVPATVKPVEEDDSASSGWFQKLFNSTAPPPTEDFLDAPFSQCGRPEPGNSVKIYGGRIAPAGKYPWLVSVQTKYKGSPWPFVHSCGGTLIESCWVLTAAHCISDEFEMQVVLGGVDIAMDEEYDQVIPVEETIVHRMYKTSSSPPYDTALLRLKHMEGPYCAKETRFVKRACLPNHLFRSGSECVIAGWGTTKKNKHNSRLLLEADVLLFSQEQCMAPKIHGSRMDDSMLCAGSMEGGVDTCKGDSGGPLVCEQDGTYYVVGVVSWGNGCGFRNKPGVYSNVYVSVDWIQHVIS